VTGCRSAPLRKIGGFFTRGDFRSSVLRDGGRQQNFDSEGALLLVTPGDRSRIAPGLAVCTLTEPPELSDFQEIAFLGNNAYSRVAISKGTHARCSYTLVVNHSNQWYQISYSETRAYDANPSTEIPEMMMLYVQSFRP
jgi:hypothetical protein